MTTTQWTPETWCACPKCGGPSLPVDIHRDAVAGLSCHACLHDWTPTMEQRDRATKEWGRLKKAGMDSDAWMLAVELWRDRIDTERAKYERAMRGEW